MDNRGLYCVGDVVEEYGEYECKVCDDLGIEVKETLKTGDCFPECSCCDDTEIWYKI
jgi:hypothetical protein